jgi:transaldolase/glucose-6-phosphate isomerase
MRRPREGGAALALGPYQRRATDRLEAWQRAGIGRRLWAHDPTIWSPEPAPELADRLGWLRLPEVMPAQRDALAAFTDEVRGDGVRHVVLLGMGGSSLAPEVFQQICGQASGYPTLTVLDSTHPAAVRGLASQVDLARTLFVVSSKSGTTTETSFLFQYFWQRVAERSPQPGSQFVAITDPGTPLAQLAEARAFRRIWLAPPEVGGRFSALSVFGLVPAALIGADLERLLAAAGSMAAACGPSADAAANPGLVLGAALAELALAGRDKLTLATSSSLASLPAWIEQLVAESTGKDGRGIVPVPDEGLAPEAYGDDRFFIYMKMRGDDVRDLDRKMEAVAGRGHPVARLEVTHPTDIGGEVFRWEVAVAAAGAALGIHPFNQPDVQLAKDLAARAMEAGRASPAQVPEESMDRPETLARSLQAWLGSIRPGDYVAVQAFLAPVPETSSALQEICRSVATRLHVAATAGYGPRFLHSTGQLHKGGPDTGVFLQLVDNPTADEDLAVSEAAYTFGALIRAQARGDLQALRQRGRRVLRINLGADTRDGLRRLVEAMRSLA